MLLVQALNTKTWYNRITQAQLSYDDGNYELCVCWRYLTPPVIIHSSLQSWWPMVQETKPPPFFLLPRTILLNTHESRVSESLVCVYVSYTQVWRYVVYIHVYRRLWRPRSYSSHLSVALSNPSSSHIYSEVLPQHTGKWYQQEAHESWCCATKYDLLLFGIMYNFLLHRLTFNPWLKWPLKVGNLPCCW